LRDLDLDFAFFDFFDFFDFLDFERLPPVCPCGRGLATVCWEFTLVLAGAAMRLADVTPLGSDTPKPLEEGGAFRLFRRGSAFGPENQLKRPIYFRMNI
jgi:hypothetical protein